MAPVKVLDSYAILAFYENEPGAALVRGLLVAAAVGDALPEGCRLRDLGEHRLKDLRNSDQLFQVVAEGVPDVVKAPNTAGALGARDRIVVNDPDAASGLAMEDEAVVVDRDVPETLAALRAVIRGDERTLVLTAPQVPAAAQHRPADLTEFRLGRVAEWSQPRYRLDGRFVDLTLLVDQGEESPTGRWAAKKERYDDLGSLLAGVTDPAIVVLGPPGGGNTLLTHLKQPNPVGVFVEDDSPEGVSDLSGNTADRTSSIFRYDEDVETDYPYDPTDGRELVASSADVLQSVRGGSWEGRVEIAHAAYRHHDSPDLRLANFGFRLRSAGLL